MLEYHSTWAGLGLRCLTIIFILSFTFVSKNNNILQLDTILNNEANRDIRKVRKRQHQYPEFGHTQGEIFKNLQKSTLELKVGMKLRKPSISKSGKDSTSTLSLVIHRVRFFF